MKKIKKLTAVIMTIVMLLTFMPLASIDFTKASALDGEGSYDLPSATLTATPVIRTAEKVSGYGNYKVGSTIVQATPSGVPYTEGDYANEAYSGETPEWPSVTFECDRSLAADSVSLETNITDAQIEVSNPTDSKWVWSVKGGTISAGTFADFTVSYSYTYTDSLTGKTITKDYKAYASSYVDNVIQPAGMYISSDRTWALHSNNKCEAVVRILGQNTKGSYYSAGEDMGSDEWAHGVYDFQTKTEIGWGNTAAAYPQGGTVLYKSEKRTNANTTTNKTLDCQRPVSSTYIDTSKGTALDSEGINLRYSAFFFDEHSQEYDSFVNNIACLDGEKSYEAFNPEDSAAAQELDFALKNGDITYASTCEGKGKSVVYNTSNPYAVLNSANSDKVFALNIPFRGTDYANSANLATLADGNKLVKYTFVNAPSQRYYATDAGQRLDIYNAVNLNLYLYNKAELRSVIEAVDDEIGVKPQEWFYDNTDGSYDTYLAALTDALHINAKYDTNQNDIDAAAEALNAAVADLKIAQADFTAANEALARYNSLNSADYTAESWAAVEEAKAALGDMNYTIFYQPLVDDLTAEFVAAMEALVVVVAEPADYTAVFSAIAYANGLKPNDCTDESWANLMDAIHAVVYDLDCTHQGEVDAMATAINEAIDALDTFMHTPEPDFSEINGLLDEIAGLNEHDYTPESWANLERAVDAVMALYSGSITQQVVYDAVAALRAAIDALEKVHVHTFSHAYVPSTCAVQGMEYDICDKCGETTNQTVLPLAEHTWSEWVRTLAPTTEEEGIDERTCSVCGAVETRFVEKLNKIVDEATGVSVVFSGDQFPENVVIDVVEVANAGDIEGAALSINGLDLGSNAISVIYDITPTVDGKKVQPTGNVKIRIPLPENFDTSKNIFAIYVNPENTTTEKSIKCKVVDGFAEFEVSHFSRYAIYQLINTVRKVKLPDISLKYNETKALNPTITADDGVNYTVRYESYDNSIADVERDGTIHANGSGKTSIRCIVTDEYGNTESDIFDVSVGDSFIQHVFRVILSKFFGEKFADKIMNYFLSLAK